MEKVTLYDIELKELGLLYNFEFQEQKGFSILIDDGELQITELYTEETAPYQNHCNNFDKIVPYPKDLH